jgi:hypothetical protein
VVNDHPFFWENVKFLALIYKQLNNYFNFFKTSPLTIPTGLSSPYIKQILKNMRNYYDFEEEVQEITHLYQLRHNLNLFGIYWVAKETGIDTSIIEDLYDSDIHGSKSLSDIIGLPFQEQEILINEWISEETERRKKIENAFRKNQELIRDLKDYRKNALGIGTNKIKRRLSKIDSPLSKALRLALDIEDVNIQAKDTWGEYRERKYDMKRNLITQLIILFEENKWIYGRGKSDVADTTHIIYFDIPETDQISWHCDLSDSIKEYPGEWDGIKNSTLKKLFESIEKNYSKIIY